MIPKVSIIIPVYNGSNYLAEAIDSALAQSYPNVEVIVVNDGSTDNGETDRIAKSYGHSIRYISKENGGVSSALNRGIEVMAGEYFSWLSHDDLYHRDKISKQIELLSSLSDKDSVICSYYATIDGSGQLLEEFDYEPDNSQTFRYWITWGSRLNGCTLLVPKVAFEQVGNFNQGLLTSQDYDLWFRIGQRYRFVFVKEVLVFSRTHPGQTSVVIPKKFYDETNKLKIAFYKELEHHEFPQPKHEALLRLATSVYYQNLFPAALYLAREAMKVPHVSLPATVLYIKSFIKKTINAS